MAVNGSTDTPLGRAQICQTRTPSPPNGVIRPFHRKSTGLTQLTLGSYVVQIWSRNTPGPCHAQVGAVVHREQEEPVQEQSTGFEPLLRLTKHRTLSPWHLTRNTARYPHGRGCIQDPPSSKFDMKDRQSRPDFGLGFSHLSGKCRLHQFVLSRSSAAPVFRVKGGALFPKQVWPTLFLKTIWRGG